MKKLIIYTILVLTLFVACGVVFVRFHPASAQGAASHTTAQARYMTNPDCAGRDDLVKIVVVPGSGGQDRCYANAGTQPLAINHVFSVCGGNNAGSYTYYYENQPDPVQQQVGYFDKGKCDINPGIFVASLTIY